jgi:glutamine amidotransferase
MPAAAVTLVDAGTGNLHSVYNALRRSGVEIRIADKPQAVRAGGRVVLPGVGAFEKFMMGLRQRGLVQPLLEVIRRGDPLLGICVGMQALFEVGEEMGEHPGLGVLSGRVVRFHDHPDYKVPQTGWNQLYPREKAGLFANIEPGSYVYFNHSYYCQPADPGAAAALTPYRVEFASAVQRDNIYGVQFHPEKSQQVGLRILANFLAC